MQNMSFPELPYMYLGNPEFASVNLIESVYSFPEYELADSLPHQNVTHITESLPVSYTIIPESSSPQKDLLRHFRLHTHIYMQNNLYDGEKSY